MSNKRSAVKMNGVSKFEMQMRKGVDYVFQKEEPIVDVLAEMVSELEEFLGKEETINILVAAWATDGFGDSTYNQIYRLSAEVERLCRSIRALSEANLRWHILLGRIYSELEARRGFDT